MSQNPYDYWMKNIDLTANMSNLLHALLNIQRGKWRTDMTRFLQKAIPLCSDEDIDVLSQHAAYETLVKDDDIIDNVKAVQKLIVDEQQRRSKVRTVLTPSTLEEIAASRSLLALDKIAKTVPHWYIQLDVDGEQIFLHELLRKRASEIVNAEETEAALRQFSLFDQGNDYSWVASSADKDARKMAAKKLDALLRKTETKEQPASPPDVKDKKSTATKDDNDDDLVFGHPLWHVALFAVAALLVIVAVVVAIVRKVQKRSALPKNVSVPVDETPYTALGSGESMMEEQ